MVKAKGGATQVTPELLTLDELTQRVGLSVRTLFGQRFAHALQSALISVVVATLLLLGYTYRFELGDVAQRVLAELLPGRTATSPTARPAAEPR